MSESEFSTLYGVIRGRIKATEKRKKKQLVDHERLGHLHSIFKKLDNDQESKKDE